MPVKSLRLSPASGARPPAAAAGGPRADRGGNPSSGYSRGRAAGARTRGADTMEAQCA